jgi:hypothetical protein
MKIKKIFGVSVLVPGKDRAQSRIVPQLETKRLPAWKLAEITGSSVTDRRISTERSISKMGIKL